MAMKIRVSKTHEAQFLWFWNTAHTHTHTLSLSLSLSLSPLSLSPRDIPAFLHHKNLGRQAFEVSSTTPR